MVMRRAALALVLLALAGCAGNPVDTWAAEQADRLTEAGVTWPPEQERRTIVMMVTACAMKETGDTQSTRNTFMTITPIQADWITQFEAGQMYGLADQEFCRTIPDAPLGETE